MKIHIILASVLTMGLASCTTPTESDEALIEVAHQPVLLSDTTSVYSIDTVTSFIEWVGTKPTGWHNGIIRFEKGSIYLYEDTVVAAKVIIDLTSIDVLDLKDNKELYDKLINHLISKDFLDIKKYPKATFELVAVTKYTQDKNNRKKNEFTISEPNFMVKGNLTIRDITVGITFPARIEVRNFKLEVSAKFNIDRTNWNITYMNEMDPVARAKDSFIHNTVNVGFTFIARENELFK